MANERTTKRAVFTEEVTVPESAERRPEALRLIVFGVDPPVSHPIPEGASVTVGRSIHADVYLKDPALSRVHVKISAGSGGNPGLVIRDLGSSNGTRLSGKRLDAEQDYPFQPGDLIDVGRCTLVVQRGVTLERAHRVWSYGYFELRLEEECNRSKRSGLPFALLRVRVSGGSDVAIETALTSFLGAQDVIARYAPAEYDVLLSGGTPESADQAVAGIRFGLSRLEADVSVGRACFPRDGQTPEALIAYAGAAVRGEAEASEAGDMVIESPAMRQLYQLVARVASSDISVLVLGETGSGKEVLAKNIHARSKRSDAAFVPLNCGAFPHELLESELFGHERGAFTGAVKAKRGLLESAEGGTVFLDEVGEMSLATQVKLLRVLEERQVRRVGGLSSIPIDVRFIAATNRDLEREVAEGRFREDLFYRLNGIALVVPPLRERPDEIPAFVRAFAREACAREGRSGDPRFSAAALSALGRYAWPGNVRELKNVVERAVILAGNEPIDLTYLPMEKLLSSVIFASPRVAAPLEIEQPTMPLAARDPPIDSPPRGDSLHDALARVERQKIVDALDACGGNQSRAAEVLGMSRKALLRRLDQYGIPRPRKGHSR